MTVCSRCGFQNLAEGRYCGSCGTPLNVQYPNSPLRQSYPSTPPPSGMSSTAKVIIVVVVLVAVLGVASTAVFIATIPASFSTITHPGEYVNITLLTLAIIYPNYPNQTTGWFGNTFQFLHFGQPILLALGQTYPVSFTLSLASNETVHSVSQVNLGYSSGFTIQSISPNPPPFTMSGGQTTTMTVTLQAPDVNYNGPVTIDLFTH